MLKEYIDKLQGENETKIQSLEHEMSELMSDLSCSEKLLEKLEQERMKDTNIFSPRTINANVSDQIDSKQKEIRTIKQKIEYVSQRLEECISSRNEYNQMETELIKTGSMSYTKPDDTTINDSNSTSLEHDKNVDDQEKSSIHERSDNCNPKNPVMETMDSGKNGQIDRKELEQFLKSMTQKTERSITLLNGNKNRCRSELQSMIKMIHEFEQGILI